MRVKFNYSLTNSKYSKQERKIQYPMSRTQQGRVTVLSIAKRYALFLQLSLSMSRYDVVPKSMVEDGCTTLSWLSSPSTTTHSDIPVTGSYLNWNIRSFDPELMAQVRVGIGYEPVVRKQKDRCNGNWKVSKILPLTVHTNSFKCLTGRICSSKLHLFLFKSIMFIY